MTRLFPTLIAILMLIGNAYSQEQKPKNSRFDFAQTTLGIGLHYSNSGNVDFVDGNGQLQSYQFENQFYPVLYFGGLHFWNSTELYFGLPFGQLLNKNPSDNISITNNLSTVFCINYYPWKINNRKVRPYIGSSISGINYDQNSDDIASDGALFTKIVFPIHGGLSWRKNKTLVDVQLIYNYDNQFEYFISQNKSTTVTTPPLYYSASFKLLLEGTKGSEKYHYSGNEARNYELLKAKRLLNSFYVAIGPSTSFFTRNNEYNTYNRPFIPSALTSNVFFDIGLGYFYEPLNAFAGISYRKLNTNSTAYGYEQNLQRRSYLFEFNKFLFDYQGFVPYLGIGLSFDQLRFEERELDEIIVSKDQNSLNPTLIFGWDILPTKLEYMTLRTNLRYTPSLNIDIDGLNIPNAQLEFNIIQFVFYPQRFVNFRRNKI